jgi:hypothetical protein
MSPVFNATLNSLNRPSRENPMRSCVGMAFCLSAILLFLRMLPLSPLVAQEPVPNEKPEIGSAREQTIYIPYEKLRDVFEREGRGVFLPYDQFQKLWQEARSANQPPKQELPPVDAILVSVENTATIEKEVMVVRALVNAELLRTGWQKIPLRLNDAALLSATIDDQPARIIHDQQSGYALLVQNKESKPAAVQIKLEYAKAYEKTPGQNSVSIMAPQAPLNQWRIRIPDPGVKVQVEPMLATTDATKAPEGEALEGTEPKSIGTEVLAFVGAAPSVRIKWVPKSEGAAGLTPLAKVQTQHVSIIEEGMMRTTVQFSYAIERSELSQLAIGIPANQKIINVFDPNIRKWSVEPNAAKQDAAPKLIVELFEPARQTQNLVVELETPIETKMDSIASVEPLTCLDANQQQGVVAIRVGQGLRAEPTERKGLMQLDPAELPKPLSNETWSFAYRFTSVPFELRFKLDKVLPTIRVEQWVDAILEPQSLTLELSTIHKIENAGVFQLEFDIPADFELLQVAGRSGPNLEAASIDTHRFANDTKDLLIVNLNRRAMGNVGTLIQLRKKLSDPNLISPTGVASSLPIPIPRSSGEFIQWIDGFISIRLPESLRANPIEKTGVREGISAQSRGAWPSNLEQRFPELYEAIAFSHAMEPVELTLEVERKRPFVTSRQLLQALVEPGSVKFTSTFFVKVQYSSIASIRIDVPEPLAREIRVESAGVREAVISPAPADLATGYVAWELVADTPWLGERTLQMAWVKRLDGLEIGKSVQIDVPRLVVRNMDQSWGQIVLNRKDSIDLQSAEGSTGLRPIDPRYDLMPGVSYPDAARAFEFQGDWSLKVNATRYALEQVKQTSIERAFVRAVVTRSNRIGVHAVYRMRNARQRLALTLPEGAEFDSQPLLINGQSASLERGDGNKLYIPLAGFDPTQPLVVELKYTTPGDQTQIDMPAFPDVPAVQAAYLGVFLPKERLLLASNGPWTEEFQWQRDRLWKAEPSSRQTPAQLVAWVKQGVNVNANNDFQTDGIMYLYSTLRPEDAPVGSLRLQSIDERWWSALIILPLVVLGLLFLGRSFQSKVVTIAVLMAGVIATGVFAPTLASQLLNWPSIIGGVLVTGLWSTRGLVRFANARSEKRSVGDIEPSPPRNENAQPPLPPESNENDAREQGEAENV